MNFVYMLLILLGFFLLMDHSSFRTMRAQVPNTTNIFFDNIAEAPVVVQEVVENDTEPENEPDAPPEEEPVQKVTLQVEELDWVTNANYLARRYSDKPDPNWSDKRWASHLWRHGLVEWLKGMIIFFEPNMIIDVTEGHRPTVYGSLGETHYTLKELVDILHDFMAANCYFSHLDPEATLADEYSEMFKVSIGFDEELSKFYTLFMAGEFEVNTVSYRPNLTRLTEGAYDVMMNSSPFLDLIQTMEHLADSSDDAYYQTIAKLESVAEAEVIVSGDGYVPFLEADVASDAICYYQDGVITSSQCDSILQISNCLVEWANHWAAKIDEDILSYCNDKGDLGLTAFISDLPTLISIQANMEVEPGLITQLG